MANVFVIVAICFVGTEKDADVMARALDDRSESSLWVLSIMPKTPEISVRIQMERSVSVSSDRSIGISLA